MPSRKNPIANRWLSDRQRQVLTIIRANYCRHCGTIGTTEKQVIALCGFTDRDAGKSMLRSALSSLCKRGLIKLNSASQFRSLWLADDAEIERQLAIPRAEPRDRRKLIDPWR